MAHPTMRAPPAHPSADLHAAFSDFLRAHPAYAATRRLDELRSADYARLDRGGHVYLDYAGGGLHADSQVRRHVAALAAGVYGNPHSGSQAAHASRERVEGARAAVLRHFRASPAEYLAVFTANASAALKLVGESYRFGPTRRLLLCADNHNSVNGIREFARARGAPIRVATLRERDLRLDAGVLRQLLSEGDDPAEAGSRGLFAYPAQSNFSGVQHPLELIEEAQRMGWDVLLDAAAFVPTHRLDLGRWKPEFVAVSFYKMFGYPTGAGCLLLRRSALGRLARPWFAGGTVEIASVRGDAHRLAPEEAGWEDGTVNYLGVIAVEIGLHHLESIGIERIHQRVLSLTRWLLERLAGLRHGNGTPLVRLHGPRDGEARGATVAFNLLDPRGKTFDIARVEHSAAKEHISLRTGCFCNPGTGETIYGLDEAVVASYFRDGASGDFEATRARIREEHGLEVGAIRVSMGVATNFPDVHRFLSFVEGFRGRNAEDLG